MLNYLRGFVSSGERIEEAEYEFIYIYFSSSYKHVKIGRSVNKKTLKGRYSAYKTQDNSAMMIAYETKMCNTIEEYLRERILPTFRLNGEQSKKSDECYTISLIAAKYAISYTIAKVEYQLPLDNSVSLNPEILYYLCTYSKDDPETLVYKENSKITIIPYRSILLPLVSERTDVASNEMSDIADSFTKLTLTNTKEKRKSLPVVAVEKKEDLSKKGKRSTVKISPTIDLTSDVASEVKPTKRIGKPQDYIQNFVTDHILESKDDHEFVDSVYDAYTVYIDRMKDISKDNICNCGRAAFTPRLKAVLGIEKLTYINSKPCVMGYKLRQLNTLSQVRSQVN